jgi:60 kDa SS-A/Ro ribonucleoprotein
MKFNLLSKTKNYTVNHEGAQAYKLSPEMELYTLQYPELKQRLL